MIYVTRIYTYTVQVIQSARPTMESGRGYASADLLEIHLKSIFPSKTSLKKKSIKIHLQIIAKDISILFPLPKNQWFQQKTHRYSTPAARN